MTYTDAEAVPLIGGPRRRTNGPQYPNNGNHNMNRHDEPIYDKHNRKSSSSSPSFIRRCCSSCTFCCCSFCCSQPSLDQPALEYYEDTTNDQPWECTFGTNDNDGIWVNYNDQVGTIMSSMVWILIIYSMVTITLLAQHNHLPDRIAIIYETICALALASHSKTMFTDPGSIPIEAVPLAILFKQGITTHAMCSHCQTYKPPNSHHCRICNRCISRMDHHCPWMNNCVGAANMKHFILFLCYTWIGCSFALIIFALNYFFCDGGDCVFSPVLVQLVRAMTLLCLGTLIFVSSMLMNVLYGIMTGIGTIDRLKKKANDTYFDSDDEPIPLKDIFGIQGYWTWILPIDPIFEDHDRVMGYSIPQRLLRERQMTSGMPPITPTMGMATHTTSAADRAV